MIVILPVKSVLAVRIGVAEGTLISSPFSSVRVTVKPVSILVIEGFVNVGFAVVVFALTISSASPIFVIVFAAVGLARSSVPLSIPRHICAELEAVFTVN